MVNEYFLVVLMYALSFLFNFRVYCLIGDGESAEGSIWEAMSFASFYKLDNLVAIFDINRLGQSDPTPLQHNVDVYSKRCAAFGFHPIVVDGHSVTDLADVRILIVMKFNEKKFRHSHITGNSFFL